MKTQIMRSKIVSIIKQAAYVGMLATLLASCGGDSNSVDGNNTSVNTFGGPSTADIANRTGVQCEQNGGRLADEVYHTTNYGQNQLYGPLTQGALPAGGSTSATFVGTSAFGDIMTVYKMTNGTQVVGYNVSISYCTYRTQEGYPLIDNNRGRRTEIGGIVLDSDNFCGIGSVDAASSTVNLDAWQGQTQQGYPIYDYARRLDKTYFKPNCNGQY